MLNQEGGFVDKIIHALIIYPIWPFDAILLNAICIWIMTNRKQVQVL